MKDLLLDSHELIWVLFEPERIKPPTKRLISEADTITVSLISLWELALKHAKGKLAYSPAELLQGAEAFGARLLAFEAAHILALQHTKTTHKDPFDRMLLAQAKTEGLALVTVDIDILKLKLDYVIDASK